MLSQMNVRRTMTKIAKCELLILGVWMAALGAIAAEPAPAPRKTAIFVKNTAGDGLNDKVAFLEDQVASRVGGKDFAVISREDVINAIKIYPTDQPAPADRNALGTKLDRLLSDNSSTTRLAQNMGADFVLLVSIGSLGKTTNHLKLDGLGVETSNVIHNLRGTYKMIEAVTGGALGGGPVKATKSIRSTASSQTGSDDVVNELLEDIATQVAEGFLAKAATFKATTAPDKVEISIACAPKDVEGHEVSLPDLRLNENNEVTKGEKMLTAQVSATIEIDGIAMGTTPAKIKIAPGLHKLRLTRPGFIDVEQTINGVNGLTLNLTMQMSPEGFQRWKQVRDFLDRLDISRKLTDAQVKAIEGYAQMLRQSGIRVDTKEGLKVYKSLY